jgi:D-beta-D-heptose 7-phosphate kinase / D-beta-D-heptose 1-phosphate adenosyltransferase
MDNNIIVVGDVMLDSYWLGSTTRISPEAPVPIVKIEKKEFKAGGAANVAANIASLGNAVKLLGMVGKDEAGKQLTQILEQLNVECNFINSIDHQTITKLRVISQSQQLLRIDFDSPFNLEAKDEFEKLFLNSLQGVNVLVLSDYNKGTLCNCSYMINTAKNRGIKVIVDPKGNDFSIYRGSTILTPNYSEFEAIVGFCNDDEAILDKAKKLIIELELEALLITRSEHGMTLVQDDKMFNIKATAQQVFDVTGAGDTVVAVLAVYLSAGKSFKESATAANRAAGKVVAKLGTSVVTMEEIN